MIDFYYRILLASCRFLARRFSHNAIGKGAIWLLTAEATEE